MATEKEPELRFYDSEEYAEIPAGDWDQEGTTCILVDAEGRVLLHLRDDIATIRYPNHWTLPGGVVEPGETPERTIRRELEEEIGRAPDEVREVGRIVDAYRNLIHVYAAPFPVPLGQLTLGEGQALGYYGASQLAEMTVTPHALVVLRRFLGSRNAC